MINVLPMDIAEKIQLDSAVIASELQPDDKYNSLLREILEGDTTLAKLILHLAQTVNPDSDLNQLTPFIIGCHYMHRASVICDDIIDADKIDSLAGKHGPSRALLLGLSTWYMAERKLIEFVSQPGLLNSNEDRFSILDYMHQVLILAAKGQFAETDEPGRFITVEQSLERAAFKSGLYMEMILKTTALVAGADRATADKYGAIGYKLGLIIQLAGDLTSLYETNPRRNNLYERHFSLPMAYALQNTPTPELKASLTALWTQAREATEQAEFKHVERIREVLEQAGGVQGTLLNLHHLHSQLVSQLQEIDSPVKEELLRLSWHYVGQVSAFGGANTNKSKPAKTLRLNWT